MVAKRSSASDNAGRMNPRLLPIRQVQLSLLKTPPGTKREIRRPPALHPSVMYQKTVPSALATTRTRTLKFNLLHLLLHLMPPIPLTPPVTPLSLLSTIRYLRKFAACPRRLVAKCLLIPHPSRVKTAQRPFPAITLRPRPASRPHP